jgi:hypothetical protein
MLTEQFKRRIFRIVFFSDLHATRFTLGLAELIWAITLAWPGTTFERQTYAIMASIAPEMYWVVAFGITGILQWYILCSCHYHNKFVVAFTLWNSTLWTFVALSIYASVTPPAAAISGEAALAIAAIWLFIRTGYSVIGKRSTDHGH